MDKNDTLSRAAALLDDETTMVLATAGPDGALSATPLFYIPEGMSLYWLSSPDSRHSRNLGARAQVAVTVFASVRSWRDIRGLQMEGEALAVEDSAERERIIAAYRQRFGLGEDLGGVISGSTLYVFRPAWVRYIDNTKGFGLKQEWTT